MARWSGSEREREGEVHAGYKRNYFVCRENRIIDRTAQQEETEKEGEEKVFYISSGSDWSYYLATLYAPA